MYMNNCQKYIAELIAEYGPLLQRQLLAMVKHKFDTPIDNLDGYIYQMCRFSEYEKTGDGDDAIVGVKDTIPDYDIIRSVEVMLAFMPQVVWHRKSKDFISLCFFISTPEHDKEIYIIPVHQGYEDAVTKFANDKFEYTKSEVVMFLLESVEQMKSINPDCYCKFAILGKDGVSFFKKSSDKQ